ncbi:hypothetical protein [Rubellimicrobium aerolatum]|uniref:Glycosyltransferase family 4 protein n=1 Tax=Rubellimicrobium aerolatum TaxID=490979 RepID=A0ABW0S9W5_9RHOB|nr:hypothetical protein [Rubellimicrobium aerolatum]MBP1805038.1 hypothetical protein [Rubellimicrobium aerolatum]
MSRPSLVFVVNLLQDVNVLRPLAFLAGRETGARLRFLVTSRFFDRDAGGVWKAEIDDIARRIGAEVDTYGSAMDAVLALQGGWGALIAASESDLSGHVHVHEVFRAAPPGYLRITLQHGLECVGFLQNREHVMAHGESVTFAADVVCAWMEPSRLLSLHPSQRAKVRVTGPTSLLSRPEGSPAPARSGLVCENLHSVRLRASGEHGRPFMETFGRFCGLLGSAGERVTLRPHPGGQYVLKNRVALPPNVAIENRPMYRVDLTAFDWGISAPSTVVLDMALAGIPVGVWQDPEGVMDLSTYEGLHRISTLEEWMGFVRDARARPEAILARQRRWLEGLEMPLDPAEVYHRFARLLRSATVPRTRVKNIPRIGSTSLNAASRTDVRSVHVVSDQTGPTQAIHLRNPIADTVTMTFADCSGGTKDLQSLLPETVPDVLVLSRLTSAFGGPLIDWAATRDIPVVFHIDDDLLEVPEVLGREKTKRYRDPVLLRNLRANMEGSDLVYASTRLLADRLRKHGISAPIVAGAISGSIDPGKIRSGRPSPTPVLGYMGTKGHVADFDLVTPAILRLMDEIPALRFETFGTIAMPDAFRRFGSRVHHHPPVPDYDGFMDRLWTLGWWVGIAPLVDHPFNRCKTETKWVEYSAAGIAVVAQDLEVYRGPCAGGAGRLAATEDEWLTEIRMLLDDQGARASAVAAAQAKLRRVYSRDALREQVLAVFKQAQAARPSLRRAG